MSSSSSQAKHDPADAATPAEDELNLADALLRYVAIVRRRLWIILAVLAVGVTAMVVYTLRQPKIYAATATVIINPQAPRVLGSDNESVIELGAGSYWSNKEYYNTQIDIIESFPLARRSVVQKQAEVPFYELLVPVDSAPHLTTEERIDAAAAQLKGMTSANQNRDSRVVSIRVTHSDPELAKDLANQQVKSYLQGMLSKRSVGADKSSKFLAAELDAAEKALRGSEKALYEFKKDKDILSVSLEDRQNIIASDISRYSAALGDARVKRIELGTLRKRALALKGEEVLESPVFALAANASSVEDLKRQYVQEKQKFLEVQEEFGPKSERYSQQKKKVDDLYARIEGEARRALRELEERYQATYASEGEFQAELERLKQEALALGPLNMEYSRVEREHKVNEETFTRLIGRLNSSDREGRNEMINVDENEYARSAGLVSPIMRRNVMVAIFLSLLLGFGFALLLDYMDRTLKTAEEVQQLVGAPLLGIIPVLTDVAVTEDPKALVDRDLYVFKHPTSRAAECCRSIRTNILFSSADRAMNTITVSSARPREGKTTTTIYMGTTMAQSGQRILIVDTDMRKPRLHKSLGISKATGLTNLILGDADYDDVIKSTDIPNLYVLPCGPQPPNPAELLLTNRFAEILAELGKRFDRVLLDSPPVLAVSDAVVLSRLSDGVMLVAQAGKTDRKDVSTASQQFRDVDATILGVILNDMDITNRRYGGYYYYQQYGAYGDAATTES